jgi:hypothetical protein
MPIDPEQRQLGYRGGRTSSGAPSWLTKILAVTVSAALLVGAIAISLVVFVIALSAVLIFGLYVWWKTRGLRAQIRAQREEALRQASGRYEGKPPEGDIIEGEVIREPRRDKNPKP